MPTIEVLDPEETSEALQGHRWGGTETNRKIAESLMTVLDTGAGVFVSGLTESSINVIRTKMSRLGIRVRVRAVDRDGKRGHVMIAKTINPLGPA